MDLLKQCQQWFEQNEIQKVIDALEAIPAGERTPELDSELAKAYIAVAHIGCLLYTSYNYPMIGSILEQDGQFYAFLESSTINPAGLSLMVYYW